MNTKNDKSTQVSHNERYREAGFLRRQYCQSRATILSVSLTAIFAGSWLIIAEEDLSTAAKLFVFAFCLCLYIISILTTLYFSKRIQLVTSVLEALEIGTFKAENEISVHADMTSRLKDKAIRYDVFDKSVIFIGGFGIIIFLLLFAEIVITIKTV